MSATTDEWIEVVWGEETFTPVKYNGFRVGPFTRRTKLREGETPEKAFERTYKQLEEMAAKSLKRKQTAFLASLKQTATAARSAKDED